MKIIVGLSDEGGEKIADESESVFKGEVKEVMLPIPNAGDYILVPSTQAKWIVTSRLFSYRQDRNDLWVHVEVFCKELPADFAPFS